MTPRLRILLALLLLTSAFAFSQATLGTMFKLGHSTTAGLPASSATIEGALIYDTDTNAPKYNNGTAWQTFGGGGSSYWYDGGSGNIQANEPVLYSGNPSLKVSAYMESNTTFESYPGGLLINHPNNYPVGLAFINGGNCPSGACLQEQLGMWYAASGGRVTPQDYFYQGLNVGTIKANLNTNMLVGGRMVGSWRRGAAVEGLTLGLNEHTGTSSTVLKFEQNNMQFDLGTGTDDYWYSDGTGTQTPGRLRVGSTTTMTSIEPTATPGLTEVRMESSATANNGKLAFYGDTTAGGTPIMYLNGNSNNPQVSIGSTSSNGAALYVNKNASSCVIQAINGYIGTSASSGQVGLQLDNAGATFAMGGGVTQFSDGTGIETASYWESTRSLASGPGVMAPVVAATGGAMSSFTAGATAAASSGSLAFNTSINQLMLRRAAAANTVGGFAPIAPDVIFDEQTLTTRVGPSERAAPPQFAEYMVNDVDPSTIRLVMTWNDVDSTTTVAGGRLWYPINTAAVANSQTSGRSTDDGNTALVRVVSTDTSPSFCQRVRTDSAVTTTRIWAGLTTTAPAAASSTMAGDGVMFRFDSVAGDTAWQVCSFDGTTQSCGSTGTTAAANTTYTLCFRLDASRNITAHVNGTPTPKTTNLPRTGQHLGAFVSIEATAASARTLYIGPMKVGWQ